MESRARERRPLCARPGCQGQTAAWLTYDYAGQRVWLDDRPSPAAISGPSAPVTPARLRAPQGWTQVDRRVAHRPDFEPPATLVS